MDKPPKTDAELAAPHFQHPQSQSNQPAFGQVFGGAPDLSTLQQQLQEALQRITMLENKRVLFATDLIGLFETVSAVPTLIPTNPYDQIKFYSNATTYRLYMYDQTNHVWRYSALT